MQWVASRLTRSSPSRLRDSRFLLCLLRVGSPWTGAAPHSSRSFSLLLSPPVPLVLPPMVPPSRKWWGLALLLDLVGELILELSGLSELMRPVDERRLSELWLDPTGSPLDLDPSPCVFSGVDSLTTGVRLCASGGSALSRVHVPLLTVCLMIRPCSLLWVGLEISLYLRILDGDWTRLTGETALDGMRSALMVVSCWRIFTRSTPSVIPSSSDWSDKNNNNVSPLHISSRLGSSPKFYTW